MSLKNPVTPAGRFVCGTRTYTRRGLPREYVVGSLTWRGRV